MSGSPTASLGQRVRWRLEYGLTLFIAGALTVLPAGLATFVSRRVGDLLRLLLRKRVRTGLENLRAAFPELAGDPGRRVALLRASFRHFATIPVELLRLDRELRRVSPQEVLDVRGRENLDAVQGDGGCCIFLTGHVGNWEVMGALSELLEFSQTAIGRGVDNPWLHRWFKEQRCRFGARIADKDGATRDVLRELRRGRSVSMLLDQHAGRHGVRVPFFGRLASTFASAAHLARRLGIPIVPGFSYRCGGLLRLRLEIFPAIWPDPELPDGEDHFRLTRYYTQCLERVVRAHPEQYLWFHRRWRPGGVEPEPAWIERYAGGVDPTQRGASTETS